MSRDWTPREKYMANSLLKKSRGVGMEDIRMLYEVNGESKEIPAISDSYLYYEYPNLCLLLGETYMKQVDRYLLSYMEEEIQRIIQLEETNEKLPDTLCSSWYQGKLGDEYHCDTNHQAFLSLLNTQAIPSLDSIWYEENNVYTTTQNGITYTLYQAYEDPLDNWNPEVYYVIGLNGHEKRYETFTKGYAQVETLYKELQGQEQERGIER